MQAAMIESAAEASANGRRGQEDEEREQQQQDVAAQPSQLEGAAHILGLEDPTPQWQIQEVEQKR